MGDSLTNRYISITMLIISTYYGGQITKKLRKRENKIDGVTLMRRMVFLKVERERQIKLLST